MSPPDKKKPESSEFLDALKKGVLIGAAILVLVIPSMRVLQKREAAQQPPVAQAPAPQHGSSPRGPAAAPPSPPRPAIRLADFAGEEASADAQQVAHWAVHTNDHKRHAFVVVDKKEARVYVFGPDGKLRGSTPALLGSAHGDDSAPGVGDKPLSALKPEEKTTPAGRFQAERGMNTGGEDVVWIDYHAAVSLHRMRPTAASERRLERLASPTVEDNRISNGCVNLPVTFYEGVLSPAVKQHGAVIYVLPETRSVQQVFGAFDPRDALQQVAFQAAAR